MVTRHEQVLDAAITLLGEQGVRAVTHRAVDSTAGLPVGSASNLFRTREALFDGIVERFAERERVNWEVLAHRETPTSGPHLARVLADFAREAVTTHRTLTLARYAILVEAAARPSVRHQLSATGSGVNTWFLAWLRIAGSQQPGRDLDLVLNYWTGMVLHELAIPDPAFDPEQRLAALLNALVPQPVPSRQ